MSYAQTLKDRIAESLNPEMQQRYKKRRADAIAQQDENYQGPESVKALADGKTTRTLISGLAEAANKFGSVGGDGGQKSTLADTMKGFDQAADTQFEGARDLYQSGIKAEDRANGALQDDNDRQVKLAGALDSAERTDTLRGREDDEYSSAQSVIAEENDPNSAVSKSYQALASKMTGGESFEGFSAARLKSLQGVHQKLYGIDETAKAKKEAAAQWRAGMAASAAERESARAAAAAERRAAQETEQQRRREEKLADEQRRKADKPPTEGQTNAALYAKRMQSAEGQLESLENSGFDRTGVGAAFRDNVLPESISGENSKMQAQAERNFITAVLRRESGAAISSGEFDTASKIYFPRLGDTEAVLKQKKQSRLDAINGIKAAAGNNATGNLKEIEAGSKTGQGFPRNVTNSKGETAVVSNAEELMEAQVEGFK